MAPPSSPNAAPSPADAKPPHPTLMGVAQAVAFFDRAGYREDAREFYTWATNLLDTDKHDRAFEDVEKHLGKQTTVEADLKAAHECLIGAIKSIKDYPEEWITDDEVGELEKVFVAYKARKQKREEEARAAASGS